MFVSISPAKRPSSRGPFTAIAVAGFAVSGKVTNHEASTLASAQISRSQRCRGRHRSLTRNGASHSPIFHLANIRISTQCRPGRRLSSRYPPRRFCPNHQQACMRTSSSWLFLPLQAALDSSRVPPNNNRAVFVHGGAPGNAHRQMFVRRDRKRDGAEAPFLAVANPGGTFSFFMPALPRLPAMHAQPLR